MLHICVYTCKQWEQDLLTSDHLPSYQPDTAKGTPSRPYLRGERDKSEGQYSTTAEIQVEEWKLSSEAHSSNSSVQDQWQQGMFL